MIAVVDTNIIFSALSKKDSYYGDFLLNNSFNWFSPSFLFVELFRHKERIIKSSKLSPAELYEHLDLLISSINFVSANKISTKSFYYAYNICKDADIKDISYIALAIELNAGLWTDDEPIKKAVRSLSNIQLFEPENY